MTILTSIIFLLLVLVGGLLVFWLLRRPEVGLSGLVFFLPFERIPSLEIAGLTLKINHLVGGLLLLVWLLALFIHHRHIKKNPLILPTFLLAMSLAASLFGAGHHGRAVFVLLATLFAIGLFLLIPQLLTKTGQLKPLILLVGLTTLMAVMFGLYQFAGDLLGLPPAWTGLDPGYTKAVFGFPRIQAFSQEPLYFANFLLLPLSLALALLTLPRPPWPRSVIGGFVAVTGLAFLLTLSRGAFVGLAASLVVLSLLLGRHLLRWQTLLIGLAAVGIIGGGTVAALKFSHPEAVNRFIDHVSITDFGRGDSTVGRLSSWSEAIELWDTSPYFGVGYGNFGPATLGYPADAPARGWPIVNNQYLELLAETGLFGLSAFGFLSLILLLRSLSALAVQSRGSVLSAVLVGLTAAMVGILAQYNFFSTLYIIPIWVTFGLLAAVQSLALRGRNESWGLNFELGKSTNRRNHQ